MRKLQFAVVAVSVLAAFPVLAQFGMPAVPSVSGGGGATVADVDKFMSGASQATKLAGDASLKLLEAVGSKKDADKAKAELKAANAIADPQEREAAVKTAQANVMTAASQLKFTAETEATIKKADAKQKAAVNASIWNLALVALQDTDLVLAGKKMGSGVPDPAVANRIPKVTETANDLKTQGEAVAKIVGSAKTLMSAVGLEALPTKASDAPKAVSVD